MEVVESPFIQIIADIVKNNKNLTPKLQDAIACFLTVQTPPVVTRGEPIDPTYLDVPPFKSTTL